MEEVPNVLAATIHGENRLSYGYASLATAVVLIVLRDTKGQLSSSNVPTLVT